MSENLEPYIPNEVEIATLEGYEAFIPQIVKIQAENQKHHVPDTDFKDLGKGYLSWQTSSEVLESVLDVQRSIIMLMREKVVAFLLNLSLEHSVPAMFSSSIRGRIEQLLALQYEEIIDLEESPIACGQIWVSDRLSKKGVFIDKSGNILKSPHRREKRKAKRASIKLYEHFSHTNKAHETPYKSRVAVIAADNMQSFNFHLRVGYLPLGMDKFNYDDHDPELKHIVLLDL